MATKDTVLIEQQILATLYNNIELLDTELNNYFVSKTGSSIFKALSILQEKGLQPSTRSVYIQAVKFDEDLKIDHLYFLKEESDNYHPKDLADYIKELKKFKLLEELKNSKLDDLTVDLSRKKVDYDIVEGKLEGMLSDLHRIKSEDNLDDEDEVKFLSREDEVKEFAEIIEKRKEGIHYPSGDSQLDEYLYNNSLMPEEISLVFAPSGSGKSTFVRNLNERRILKNLPTLEINLEMSLESTLDSKMGLRSKLDRSNFSFHDVDEENDSLDGRYALVDELIKKELSKSKKFTNYFQLNIDYLDFDLLKKYILTAKKLMGLSKYDYLYISIDLLTQMKEFNEGQGSTADKYTKIIDRLHGLCKNLKVHLLGVVQPKRPDSKMIINSIEDVDKLRVNTESLKNSGTLEERGRVLISVFRPLHFIRKYLPDDPSLDYLEDVMDIQIVKQNNGGLSPKLFYKFNPGTGLLYAYPTYDPELAFGDDEEIDDEDL